MTHRDSPTLVDNDTFYTPEDTVRQLIGLIGDMSAFDTIIEPSAGDGAILSMLPSRAVGYDLSPLATGITRMNWLEPVTVDGDADDSMYIPYKAALWGYPHRTLVIGNPPFGRQGVLASRFINECSGWASTVAFIMPRSFLKDSMMNRIDRRFHVRVMEPVIDDHYRIPSTADTRIVPTIILILDYRDTPRTDHISTRLSKLELDMLPFEFCSREDADYMIVRVGSRSGSLEDLSHVTDTNAKYNYFIRIRNQDADIRGMFTRAMPAFHRTRSMTTGPRSLSKAEIVRTLLGYPS